MNYQIQILTTYSNGIPSLLIQFPQQYYLINCPEGIQRLINGKRIKIWSSTTIGNIIGNNQNSGNNQINIKNSGNNQIIQNSGNKINIKNSGNNQIIKNSGNSQISGENNSRGISGENNQKISGNNQVATNKLTTILFTDSLNFPSNSHNSDTCNDTHGNTHSNSPSNDPVNFPSNDPSTLPLTSFGLTSSSPTAGFPGLLLTLLSKPLIPFTSLHLIGNNHPFNPLHSIINKWNYKLSYSKNYSSSLLSFNQINLNDTNKRKASPIPHSFLITGPERRGKFLVENAKKLGIPPGPLYSKLSNGQSIEFNGKIISPEMVLDNPIPPSNILLLDIPNHDTLDSFEKWLPLQDSNTWNVILAFLGPTISTTQTWNHFISTLSKNQFNQHLLIFNHDDEQLTIPLEQSTRLRWKTSLLSTSIFPNPFKHIDLSSSQPSPLVPTTPKIINNLQIYNPQPNDVLQISPKLSFIPSTTNISKNTHPLNHPDEEIRLQNKSCIEIAQKMSSLAKLSDTGDALDKMLNPKELTIIPLGTGSAIPSPYRNVSSTLIGLPSGYWFLDVGEGTKGQILTMVGNNGFENILKRLKGIVISHFHADHVLGIFTIIQDWLYLNLDTTLTLLIPKIILGPIQEYFKQRDMELRNIVIHTSDSPPLHVQGLKKWIPIRVNHCKESYAHVLHFECSKISFSGDCRPSINFAKESKDVDLMIHESTFCNEFQKDAHYKKHCTIQESIDIFKLSNAKNLLLTHFSQRYAKIPPNEKGVMIAFDQMVLSKSDFEGYERLCSLDEGLWKGLMEGEDDEIIMESME